MYRNFNNPQILFISLRGTLGAIGVELASILPGITASADLLSRLLQIIIAGLTIASLIKTLRAKPSK